jgi:hypothetical protein
MLWLLLLLYKQHRYQLALIIIYNYLRVTSQISPVNPIKQRHLSVFWITKQNPPLRHLFVLQAGAFVDIEFGSIAIKDIFPLRPSLFCF